MSFQLDYDVLIFLDAEELAEAGIGRAYESLLPQLRKYVPQPERVEEAIDNDAPRYSLRCEGKEFAIFDPAFDDESGSSWGRAAFAFFTIVNDQLAASSHRLYAINGGNDLAGIFLTADEAQEARKGLPNKRDWPYLPNDKPPWFGQPH